ncbi:MAG: hypothetical protein KGD61_05920 [Candidatus Lokiarchaeota archaeon]|nr:hypothetical protein [Candidatus Lokiarchaeota archaeon]
MRIQKVILLLSGVIGLISVFTPVIFHVSPNYLYQFWSWGLTLFFGLSSTEVGVTYNTEVEFLIPAISSMFLILLSSSLILKSSIKGLREDEFNIKFSLIGGVMMITIPLLLMIIWHFIYTIGRGYPIFWGSFGGENYFWPSFSFLLQFLAGSFTILSSLMIKTKNN